LYTVVFRLQDAFNNNVLQSGVTVNLSAGASGGTTPVDGAIFSNNPATTDANGLVTVSWVTGTGAGSTQTLSANSAGLTGATVTAVLAP
jgi:hypothetical protein